MFRNQFLVGFHCCSRISVENVSSVVFENLNSLKSASEMRTKGRQIARPSSRPLQLHERHFHLDFFQTRRTHTIHSQDSRGSASKQLGAYRGGALRNAREGGLHALGREACTTPGREACMRRGGRPAPRRGGRPACAGEGGLHAPGREACMRRGVRPAPRRGGRPACAGEGGLHAPGRRPACAGEGGLHHAGEGGLHAPGREACMRWGGRPACAGEGDLPHRAREPSNAFGVTIVSSKKLGRSISAKLVNVTTTHSTQAPSFLTGRLSKQNPSPNFPLHLLPTTDGFRHLGELHRRAGTNTSPQFHEPTGTTNRKPRAAFGSSNRNLFFSGSSEQAQV